VEEPPSTAATRVALWLIATSAAMTALAQGVWLSDGRSDVVSWVLLITSVGVLLVAVIRLRRVRR